MFARVIPLLRTPFGVEGFDYRIPRDQKVEVGDLVLVPFRKRTVPALVEQVLRTSPFAAKALDVSGSYGAIHFPAVIPTLIRMTARRTFTSAPTVADAWLRELPKRPGELLPIVHTANGSGSMHSKWSVDATEQLIGRARDASRASRVLVLTPWKHRAEAFAAVLGAPQLTSDIAPGAAFRHWQGFLSKKHGVLVATKIGSWLAPMVDLVLIDEPENDDHKQDELAPRYDVRRIAAWASTKGARVEAYGVTPPLHVDDDAPTIDVPLEVHPRTRAGRSSIPMVESSTLDRLRDHEGPRIVVHPIRGEAAKFACRDCGWTASCSHCGFQVSSTKEGAMCRRCRKATDAPLSCVSCSGTDLGKAMPGIDRLKRLAASHEPELVIEWRESVPSDLERPLPDGCMVLVTDASLLASGGTEDVRRREQIVIAFRRLAANVARAQGTLLIQVPESSYQDWEPWLMQDGFRTFRDREREDRRVFGYPPAARLIKIIGSDRLTVPALPGLRGPFPVAHRPRTREARFVWHVQVPDGMKEETLNGALSALAKAGAIIDLDPIAFFR